MKEQDRIIKHISLVKGKDPRVVQQVVYHPFLFAKHRMADPDDYRPIRIRYFGVFCGKFMRNKEMYQRLSYIIQSLKDDPTLVRIFVDPIFTDDLTARKYVNSLFDANEKDSIISIFDAIKAIKGE